MAGSYPDAPGRKMRTYGDGTILLRGTSVNATSKLPDDVLGLYTAATGHLALIDHDTGEGSTWGATNGNVERAAIFIFPELRDIDGTYVNSTGNWDSQGIYRSADTTNGLDGTWTTVSTTHSVFGANENELPDHAATIYAWTAAAQRGVMWTGDENGLSDAFLRGFEIFGEIASGETPDRILLIDDQTALEFGVDLDVGNWPRGAAFDKSVRLKNNSATTANTIDVARGCDEDVDSSSWWTFDNGAGFGSSFQVSSLTSGSEDTFVVRMIIPTSAALGLWESWMSVAVASFA